jgi:hypothetical protein
VSTPPPLHRGPQTATLETRLLEILNAPPDTLLTTREAFGRKEVALYDAIAAAPMLEVWHLHKRVSVGRSDDQLLKGLARLAPDRRAKVIAFMGDARRREALRSRAA